MGLMNLGSILIALTFDPVLYHARNLARVRTCWSRVPCSWLAKRPDERGLEVAPVTYHIEFIGLHGPSKLFQDRAQFRFEALFDNFARTPGGGPLAPAQEQVGLGIQVALEADFPDRVGIQPLDGDDPEAERSQSLMQAVMVGELPRLDEAAV
jgi:hypothetical protein